MHTSKQLENTVLLKVFNGFRQVCIKNIVFLSFSAGGRLPENWCPNFGVHSAADVCRKKGGSSNCEVSPVRCPRHCLRTLWLPPLTNKSTKSRKHNVFYDLFATTYEKHNVFHCLVPFVLECLSSDRHPGLAYLWPLAQPFGPSASEALVLKQQK